MSDAASQKRRGLGMGLSALLGAEAPSDLDSQAMPVRMIPIAFLKPSPLQPRRRFSADELETLASSIQAKGILQPLVVRSTHTMDHGFEIIAGERRWRAAQQAGLHEVPAVIQELDDKSVLEVALIENLQREDLSAIEEAEAFQHLMNDFDYTQEQVSEIVGKSRSHIANTLRLLKLPEAVRDMVLEDRLSAGHARALLASSEPERLAEFTLAKGLSVRELEALVATGKAVDGLGRKRVVPEKDPDIVSCEQRLASTLGLKVDIKPSRKGGAMTIRYTSGDQLDLLLQRLLSTS